MRMLIALAVALAWGPTATALAVPPDTGVVNVSRTSAASEGEEAVAVDPTDPNLLLLGSNQLKPGPGVFEGLPFGPSGLMVTGLWRSVDGGRTWKVADLPPPPVTVAGRKVLDLPGEFGEAGNVVRADQMPMFDRTGRAYFEAGDLQGVVATAGDSLVRVWTSDDGGRTFGPPMTAASTLANFGAVLAQGVLGIPQADRPWLAIDRSGGPRDGTVYLTAETSLGQPGPGAVFAFASTDRGRTFGRAVRVDDGTQTQWNPRQFPVVDAAGVLYIVYDGGGATPSPGDPSPVSLLLARSDDGGKTFAHGVVDPMVRRIESPDEAEPFYVETIPAFAADPVRPGRIAVAWPNRVGAADSRILLRYSTDGGRTWSERIDVADDPPGHPNQHDHVALTYLYDGGLVALWRDRRCCGGTFGSKYELRARVFLADAAGRLRPGRTIVLTEQPQAPTTDARIGHGSLMPSEYLDADASRESLFATWDELHGPHPDNMFRAIPLAALECAPATGTLSGRRVGPAALGATIARTRAAFAPALVATPRAGLDRFCLADGGSIRVEYRAGRAAIALTSSRRYSVRGVRVGSSARAARRGLARVRVVRFGTTRWMVALTRRARLVVAIRNGRVREIGLADRRRGALRLLRRLS